VIVLHEVGAYAGLFTEPLCIEALEEKAPVVAENRGFNTQDIR
jgi:hypothetical protein